MRALCLVLAACSVGDSGGGGGGGGGGSDACPQGAKMNGQITSGACNTAACHAQNGGAAGQIHLP